jgi:hypothetical protein
MNDKTYGDFPGVRVHVERRDLSPRHELPELSETELWLCLICMRMTRSVWLDGGMLKFDLTDAGEALEVYGYSRYETRPMLQKALRKLRLLVEDGAVNLDGI